MQVDKDPMAQNLDVEGKYNTQIQTDTIYLYRSFRKLCCMSPCQDSRTDHILSF